MKYNSYAKISITNLISNYRKIQLLAKGKKTICIVKADAYGCGAVVCSKALEAAGADYFAVANLDEAEELIHSGIKTPVIILGYVPEQRAEELVESGAIANIYSLSFASHLSELAKQKNVMLKVSVKLNTGMNRLGFSGVETGVDAIARIAKMDNLVIESVFSHFATADEEDLSYAASQLARFEAVIDGIRSLGINPPLIHIQNSAALLCMDSDVTTAVRPGLILYGINPSLNEKAKNEEFLPVMSFYTQIANIFPLDDGQSVSYARTYRAQGHITVATLSAGYADGYFRTLSNKASVFIGGQRVQLIGNICMDMMMADISKLKGAKVGDEVILFGASPAPTACELADLIKTIPYEIMCAVSKRVKRVYEGI